MDTNSAALLIRQKMNEHGLNDWDWKFTNAIRKFGSCSHRMKTIILSKPLTELCTDDEVKDTILHEIAHALCPKEGHNEIWKAMAIQLGGSGNQYGPSGYNVPYKYEATCKNGHKYYTHRRSKSYSCGYCSKQFDPENILEYKKLK